MDEGASRKALLHADLESQRADIAHVIGLPTIGGCRTKPVDDVAILTSEHARLQEPSSLQDDVGAALFRPGGLRSDVFTSQVRGVGVVPLGERGHTKCARDRSANAQRSRRPPSRTDRWIPGRPELVVRIDAQQALELDAGADFLPPLAKRADARGL